jgi:protein-S-isoprenylcysteine O-methyltransferase Ste14
MARVAGGGRREVEVAVSRALRSLITFVMGAAIFVGLPLLGWGLFSIPSFFDHWARCAFIGLVGVLNAFAAIRRPEVGKHKEPVSKRVARQHVAVMLMQVLSIAAVVFGPWSDRHGVGAFDDAVGLRALGLSLYAGGFLLMHFSEMALGRQFSVEVQVQHQHRLITDGLYRHLRHPRYLGVLLFMPGIALTFRSWFGLLLALAMAGVLAWRIHDEETLMQREFGADWSAYAARTRRVIPFVY